MGTRRIRVLVGVGGADFAWRPGEVVELDELEAAKWADGQRAVYADDEPVGRPADLDIALGQLEAAQQRIRELTDELLATRDELEATRAELEAAAQLDDDQDDDEDGAGDGDDPDDDQDQGDAGDPPADPAPAPPVPAKKAARKAAPRRR